MRRLEKISLATLLTLGAIAALKTQVTAQDLPPGIAGIAAQIAGYASEAGEKAESQIEIEQNTETGTDAEDTRWGENERYLLTRIAMAEAEGQDTIGKALVICVVLNRVKDDYFPNTVQEVICQPKQFTPMLNGRWERVEPNEDCYKALEMVEAGWDDSHGALYFERADAGVTWHSTNLTRLFIHQDTAFYR